MKKWEALAERMDCMVQRMDRLEAAGSSKAIPPALHTAITAMTGQVDRMRAELTVALREWKGPPQARISVDMMPIAAAADGLWKAVETLEGISKKVDTTAIPRAAADMQRMVEALKELARGLAPRSKPKRQPALPVKGKKRR